MHLWRPVELPLDHLRHVVRRICLSLDSTDILLARDHPAERLDLYREVERRSPDLDILPVVPRECQTGLDQHRRASCVDRNGTADAVGVLLDHIAEFFAFRQVAAVDDMCAAKFLRELHTALDFVDTDDGLATLDLCTHDGAEADATEAHDDDDVVFRRLGAIDDGAAAGLDTTAQRCE
jgi:hypothetical protein